MTTSHIAFAALSRSLEGAVHQPSASASALRQFVRSATRIAYASVPTVIT